MLFRTWVVPIACPPRPQCIFVQSEALVVVSAKHHCAKPAIANRQRVVPAACRFREPQQELPVALGMLRIYACWPNHAEAFKRFVARDGQNTQESSEARQEFPAR